MLSFVRAFARSWAGKIIFVLLVIVMGMFGAQSFLGSGQLSTAVIKAGSREISPQDFKRAFDMQRRSAEQRMQRPVSPQEMTDAGVHRGLAEQLALRESLLAILDRIGLRPGDKLIAEEIGKNPAFFNPITGAFDRERFLQVIGSEQMTEKRFESVLRDDIAGLHFGDALQMGMRAPRLLGALEAAFSLETRDISWFAVTPQIVGMPAPPTDAQLQQFLKDNAAQLRRPEFRKITLVLFTKASVQSRVTINEADVRRIYDFRKDALSRAERRTFVQIPIRNPQQAQRAIAALRQGADPAAVARSLGVEAITFTDKTQSAVPDAAVAQAAFSLQAGQVSNLIRGRLGPAVVKVVSVAPGREVSFEEARPDIERALREERAGELIYEQVSQFEAAREKGAAILDAGRQVGARIFTIPVPVTEQGIAINGQPTGWPPAVLAAAFALPKGGESASAEEVGGGSGEYFAVRVDDIIPAGLPTIAREREQLVRGWTFLELRKRMERKSQELAERVRKGESIAAVAASVGAKLQTVPNLPRQPNPIIGNDLVSEIFLAKTGGVVSGVAPRAGFAVIRINSVRTPPPGPAAAVVEQRRPQVSSQLFQEMFSLAQTAARERIKPKVFPDRVNQAVGLAADAGTTAAGKGDQKKK